MSSLPLYQTLYTVLRTQIREKHFPPGGLMPGEMELAKQFNCSRVTVRKALEQLAAEGLVERRQGHGTVVVHNTAADPVRSTSRVLVKSFKDMSLSTTLQVLHFAFEVPPPRIREALKIPENKQALHTARLRTYDGKPVSYSIIWLPEEVSQNFSRLDLASKSITELLHQAGVGVCQAQQRVFATAADGVMAPLLEIEVGSPILGVERRVEEPSGRVVEYLRVFYHPERYQFELTMQADLSHPDSEWQAVER